MASFRASAPERAARRSTALVDRRAAKADKADARQAFEERKEKGRELRRLKSRITKLEGRIATLEQRQEELRAELATAYADDSSPDHAERVNRDLKQVRSEIETTYAEWEAAAATLEATG